MATTLQHAPTPAQDQQHVLVRIEVAETRRRAAPTLKKSGKEYEVYEVDGFIFKRKRKAKQLEEEKAEADQVVEVPTPPVLPLLKSLSGAELLSICQAVSAEVLDTSRGAVPRVLSDALSGAAASWLGQLQSSLVQEGNVKPEISSVRTEDKVMGMESSMQMYNKSMLRTILARMESEEQQWVKLQQGLEANQISSDEQLWQEMDGAFTLGQETKMAQDSLIEARRDAHGKLSLQIEAYSGLVSGVEALLSTAEQACNAMQAEYHRDMFRAFEHVDSPATLIKRITKRASTHTADRRPPPAE